MVHPWPELDPALMAPDPEREELRDILRSLLAKHADHEHVRAAADTELGYCPELWGRLTGELEVIRLAVPEDLGGAGFGFRELGVVLEETGAALLSEPLLAAAVGSQVLAAADDPEATADLRDSVLAGGMFVGVRLGGEALVAESSGGGWRVTGTRSGVLGTSGADVLLVDAGTAGGTVLIAVAAESAMVESCETMDLTRRQAVVRFDAAPARLVVGPARAGEVIARADAVLRAAVAAEHTGIVGELLDRIVEYVEQRQQFGRTISSFQAIKHRLADLLVDRERARAASRYAAAALDESPQDAELAVAVAAAVCADAAVRAAHEAIQLHGGIGFTWEHRAHYYLRRVLGDEGLIGPARAHRARIADLVGV